jgi:hypothetical protein
VTTRQKMVALGAPLLVAALYLVAVALAGPSGRQRLLAFEVPLVKLLALAGCAAAASRYRRGEELHTAWALLALHYGLIFITELAIGSMFVIPGLEGSRGQWLRYLSAGLANVAGALAAVLLARVGRLIGLGLPSLAWRRTALSAAIVAAALIVGWGAWKDLGHALGGDPVAITAVASDVGDLICFSAIAPLLLIALAMRGGTLAWPWGLITASYGAWMFYDMIWSFEAALGLAPGTQLVLGELARTLACALAFSAGLAQRWASRAGVG